MFIFQTLNLVEALLVFGNPECIDHFYENIDTFKYTINFDFVEEVTGNHGKSGLSFFFKEKIVQFIFIDVVREKAQLIVDLLKNKDILEEHRKNLKNLQEKVLKKSITKTDILLII